MRNSSSRQSARVARALATAAYSGPTDSARLDLLVEALIGALTTLGGLPADRREALVRRLLRPAEWTLTSTADRARSVLDAEAHVGRVWSLNDDTRDWLGRRLRALRRLPPA
ncbi:MAG: hypothetical protein JXA67_00280 [Micromonosporaceae bacterium]|nr:hypothetical protein [Micromonosporaceae bacterium]